MRQDSRDVTSPRSTSVRLPAAAATLAALSAALLLAGPTPARAQDGDGPEEPVHPLVTFAVAQSQAFFPDEPAEDGAGPVRDGGPARDGSAPATFAHAVPAPYVVLSRLDAFADSLAASVLLEASSLLFTDTDVLPVPTAEELDRLMPEGGVVYLLGGTAAISTEVEAALVEAGHEPVRLAGPTRVETAIAVADEAIARGVAIDTVALARASAPEPTAEWADSIAAAPWAARFANPILLTPGEALHPAVATWLEDHPVEATVLLGGEAALSAAVEAAVTEPRRIAGPNRFATAVEVATELYRFTRHRYRVVAADHPDGWGYALAGVPLEVEDRAPIALVGTDVLPAETDALTCRGGTRGPVEVYGDETVVSQAVRDALVEPCD